MTKLYKLTDQEMQTRGGFQWVLGEERTASGEGELCGPGWLHAYTDPLLAVLLNSIHADFSKPRLFECEGTIGLRDHDLKVGCIALTPVKELPLPAVTMEQRVRFAILCAKRVCAVPRWNEWADRWLSGKDRSRGAAMRAAAAAVRAEAARAAAKAAAAEAWAAAEAAVRAAAVAEAAAVRAEAEAAWAAVRAAAVTKLDLIAIAREACDGR